jgi:hypothetical protein
MPRRLFLIVLFCFALLAHPRAHAKEADAEDPRSEAIVRTPTPSSDFAPPLQTIVASDPFGYLGGASAVSPTGRGGGTADMCARARYLACMKTIAEARGTLL